MVKEFDYDSMKGRLNDLVKRTDTSYKRLVKAQRMKGAVNEEETKNFSPANHSNEDYDKFITRRQYDYLTGDQLGEFNKFLLKGNFERAEYSIKQIKDYLNNSKVRKHYSQEEKEKLVSGINRRIERGINYLEKNPDERNIVYMKEILSISKDIENKLLNKKHESSGLEKAITVISLGSMVLGVAIGYPALTGNAIADVVPGSLVHGAALFFVGLVGVFLANKK